MTGQKQRILPQQKLVERGHEVSHGAIRRRDDRGGPGHDMIGGKQNAGTIKREGAVVGGVARRMESCDLPAIALKALTIAKRNVGHETDVGALGKGVGFAGVKRTRSPMRPFGHGQRTGFSLQTARQGRVIAVGVADQDMADTPVTDRPHQRLEMRIVFRSGVQHGDGLAGADDVAVGAVKGEGRGVVAGQALNARCDRNRVPMVRLELQIEGRACPSVSSAIPAS